jgi:hypothetical protein
MDDILEMIPKFDIVPLFKVDSIIVRGVKGC